MRKTIGLLLVAAVAASLLAAPAHAKKKKAVVVHEQISAQLLPFPKLAAWGDVVGLTRPGCSAGQENVNWVGVPFEAPGKGSLRFYMDGFDGDWDIYIFNSDGIAVGKGEAAQVNTADPTAPAPAEEEIVFPMTKGQQYTLVVCNWLGGTEATAHYEGTFK